MFICTTIHQSLRSLRKSLVPPHIGYLPLAICYLRLRLCRAGSICGWSELLRLRDSAGELVARGRESCGMVQHSVDRIRFSSLSAVQARATRRSGRATAGGKKVVP